MERKPKVKKAKKAKGSISMSGPEKLLSAGKMQRGAAKQTTSTRVKHKKQVY